MWKLAGILRIADGLDRGHYGNVVKVKTITRRDSVSVVVWTQTDAELEIWGARHKVDMFEQVFERVVTLSARPASELARGKKAAAKAK